MRSFYFKFAIALLTFTLGLAGVWISGGFARNTVQTTVDLPQVQTTIELPQVQTEKFTIIISKRNPAAVPKDRGNNEGESRDPFRKPKNFTLHKTK